VATREWRQYYGYWNEDGFTTCHHRKWLEANDCKFAPLEEAKWFGRELEIPENQDVTNPFIFHLSRTLPGRNEEYKHLIKSV
jgi:hypothetical protein